MNCKQCHDEIEESESGQPLSQSATDHLKSCPTCSAFHNERLELRRMLGSLDVVSAPADFDFRLRARLASIKGQQEPGRVAWSRFAPSGWSLALAASFVIVLALGIVVRQFIGTQNVDSVPASIVKVVPNAPIVPTEAPAKSPENNEPAVVPSVEGSSREALSQRHLRTNKSSEVNRSTVAAGVNQNEGVDSVDSAVSSAANVFPLGISDPSLSRLAVAYPLRTAMQGSSVALSDRSAKPQAALLRVVTFGEQDVFDQSSTKAFVGPIVQRVW